MTATRQGIEVLAARDVPLGGARALTVHRTLPQRGRTLVGAWCFADAYGPTPDATAMDLPPHPHTGLQTVSWLYAGEIEPRDSTGARALVRPGQVNLADEVVVISTAHAGHLDLDQDVRARRRLYRGLPDLHGLVGFDQHSPSAKA